MPRNARARSRQENTRIVVVRSGRRLESVRTLFREYAESLRAEVCLENFSREVAELPGCYAPPGGDLFLALARGRIAGCVGLRPAGRRAGEMKRLYVRPPFRGRGIGRKLAIKVIRTARKANYSRLLLDTLPSMTEAIDLYRSLGFVPYKPAAAKRGRARIIDMRLDLRPNSRR